MRHPASALSLLVTIATLSGSSSFAQSGWRRQATGTQEALFGVSFIDADHGLVVGASGIILRTTNAGETWTRQPSGSASVLRGVSFIDAYTAMVVGSGATVLRSEDGGGSWARQDSGVPPDAAFYAVFFLDPYTGWIGGSRGVLRTDDGGDSWDLQDTTPATALFFLDAKTGWAISDIGGGLRRTTDGGDTWTSQPGSGHNIFDSDIGFRAAGHCGAEMCTGGISRTFDGGESWTYREMHEEFHALTFSDVNTGFAVGGDGRLHGGQIYRTTDGGETWTRSYFGTGPLLGVCFVDGVTGTVVGAVGTILRTTTGGE